MKLKSFILFICTIIMNNLQSQTVTPTPPISWTCGNEIISPSTYTFISGNQSTYRTNQPASPTAGIYVIPVVVHVLYDAAHAANDSFNVSYQQIQWQISQLNRGFQNLINPGLMPNAFNTQIQFCLAQTAIGATWNNNNERGVMRYQVPTSALSHTMDLPNQNNLLSITNSPTAFPFQNYLNIWLVNEIVDTTGVYTGTITPNTGVMGYASFPNTLSMNHPIDGIVIRNSIFGSNAIPNHHNILMPQLDQGNIMTHEAGHYLSLFHTFQGGCAGTTTVTCLTQGDNICDTPPSNVGNIVCTSTNTCVDNLFPIYNGDQPDMLQNFMCYADDNCTTAFTQDQSGVMWGVLTTSWPVGRQDMTTPANLANTGLTNAGVNCCPTGVTTAYFTASQTTSSCGVVSYSCVVPSCSLNQTYFWEFGDGATFTAINTNTTTHTYTLNGTYITTLTVTGTNGSIDIYTKLINVGTFGYSSAKNICNNSVQGVNFHVVTTAGTYSTDLNFNGVHATHTFTVIPGVQTELGHLGEENIEVNIPVNVPFASLPAQSIYTVTLTGLNTCPSTFIDTFNIVNCCTNVVSNGEFNNGWSNWTHPNGGYVGSGPGVVWTYTPSAHFDSPICGLPSTCSAVEMINTTISLQANTNYHLNFQVFGGNSPIRRYQSKFFLMDTLFLNARILDNLGNTISDLGIFPVLDLIDSTWHHYDFTFNNPNTISNAHLSISQIKNFYSIEKVAYDGSWSGYGWGYDYDIDEITIRPVGNPPVVVTTPSTTSVCPSITSTLTASGASTYSWTTGATTNTTIVSPSSTTIYTVLGTSVLGCTATAQTTVNINPSFISVTPSVPIICLGQTTTLTASGAYTYSWSPGGQTTATIAVSPTTTTVYTVQGTNTVTGCNNIKTVTVTVNPLPTLSINPTTPTVCIGASSILTASGANTYTWNAGITTNTISVTPTVTTSYTVTGTSSLGCNNTKTVSVVVYSGPSLSVAASPIAICVGQPSTLTANGANTYSWMPGSITYSQTVVYPSVNTTYSCTGTNTLGCITTKTVLVTVNSLPNVTAVANPTLICSSQSSTLTAGGASTYTWSTGTISVSTSVSPTITTTYTVTGNSAAGCSNTKTVTVNVVPYTPILTASSTAVAVCSSGSATMSVNGANTYTWYPSASTGSTIAVTPTVATVYTVSGNYSVSGCGTGTTSIVVNPIISTLCCSAATSTVGTSLTSTVFPAAGTYTTSSAVVYVQGVVTFTNNTSYSGYTFRMAPGSALRIYPNKTLTLTNCKLYSCSELWDGIYLINDGITWSGNVVVNNSTIEDMYNGIVMDYNNTTINSATPSGSITINGSSLNKNYISIQMKNSPGLSSGGGTYPFIMTTSTISTAASLTSPGSSLKPSSISTYTYAYNQITNGSTGASAPYLNFPRSFTGIKLYNLGYATSVFIGSRNSNTLTNTFNNLDFGINGTEVYTKVHNNYFKDITGSVKSTDPLDPNFVPAQGPDEIGIAIAITQTTTANQNSCIVGANPSIPTNTNSPYPDGNLFENCNKGVKATNNRYVTVLGNVFTTNTTSIPVSTTSGSPPMFVINPNTYYFYQGQQAVWSSALGTKADLSYNYIRNHSTGIYDSHSIYPTISGTVTIQGNDIAAPSSTGYCLQAIQVDQAGGTNIPTDQAYVYSNRLENVYRGVVSNGVLSGLLIKSNTINVEGVAKTLNYQATQQRTGVALTSCQYASVKGNSFTQNGSVPTTTTTASAINGVFVTSSINTKVECNTATNLGRCFVFQQTCSGSSWKVNSMSNSYTGLEIRTLGVMGPQGALTYTGTPNLSANTWGANITQHTSAASSPSVNITSKLYLLSGATTQPTLNFASGGGTIPYSTTQNGINVTTGTSYTCNSGSAQRLMNGSSNSTDNNINTARIAQESDTLIVYTLLATQDENDYEIFPEEMTYMNKQSVFKLLAEDSIHAVDGSNLDDFYNEQQNTAIDQLTQVQQAIANYDTTSALSINTSISASNSVEYKHQRANELVLRYMQNHTCLFNSTEMSDLFSMASECIEKGYYVVQCRNLVNIIKNTIVNFSDNCVEEANASRRIKQKDVANNSTKTNFNLYPNPNNGTMILDYDLGNYNNANINLYDITGNLINSYKLTETKGIMQMNEQNLNNGIYFYSILVGEKTIKTDKIVIIK